jgi:serine/threonine protein kinase/Tol biopolymer transport system component
MVLRATSACLTQHEHLDSILSLRAIIQNTVALNPGIRLGPYEIQDPLGAGGMGEVYRARDTRLDRTVAIKILPANLSSDPVRRQRFEREAKSISGLNHPHICVLHDIGEQDGIDYLVMECVDGETLAKRLEKGALAVEQVLKFGAQIADALDKAHRSGITHRDLKPSNIMLTQSGAKLLDFGLAKPVALATGATLTAAATQTTPVTAEGTIVGTFQYMSPEQIEGKDLDGRSDIFSLGSVLYEMLTGRPAFSGKSNLSVASAILEKDPAPIITLKPLTPPILDHAIRRCLAKDREERWQTARDLQLEIKWMSEAGSQSGIPTPAANPRRTRVPLAWAVVGLSSLIALGLIIGFAFALRTPQPAQPMRLTAEMGADANLYASQGPSAILSPDGTRLAFVATDANQKRRIYIRLLDQTQAIALSGTENARNHFFSPDGQSLGFFADGKLKRVSVKGDTSTVLCDAPDDRGGSWGEDGNIVFTPSFGAPIFSIAAAGGVAKPITTLDSDVGEVSHRWPQVLSGGKLLLFTASAITGNYENADIVLYSVLSGKRSTLHHGGFYARYLPSGRVVYIHEGTLLTIPVNLERMETTGQPVRVLDNVATNNGTGGAQFSFSQTGNFAYISGGTVLQDMYLDWMDRQGNFTHLRRVPAQYFTPVFSPEGKRVAFAMPDAGRVDVWVYTWESDTLTRLTFDGESNSNPAWTPDGRRVTYSTIEKGTQSNIYWKRADGGGGILQLTNSKNAKNPFSWRPDGKVLAYAELNPKTRWDIMTLSVGGNDASGWKVEQPEPFLNGEYDELDPAFSPDGRWVAYYSNESGSFEIYVRPFPGPGGKWQVSRGGGMTPRWSANGRELFYHTLDNRLMVADYTSSGDSFTAAGPRLWSPGQFTARGPNRNFDVHPDGQRVVVMKVPDADIPTITKVSFIFNFFEELRRKVQGQS